MYDRMYGANGRHRRRCDRALAGTEHELRIALGLLLARDHEHTLVPPGLDVVDATMPVVPPTDPAVCTRNIGLPVAPSAWLR